jgi:hypothetical protein
MSPRFISIALICVTMTTIIRAQDSSKKSLKLAAIPLINYNRTQGLMLGGIASVYYKVNKTDTISPSSNSGIAGFYTSSTSYVYFVYQQFYLDHDRWRIRGVGGKVDINFQYYYLDPDLDVGNFVSYNTSAIIVGLQVQHLIYRRIYAGLTGSYLRATTAFGIKNVSGGDSVSINTLNFLGYILSNDSRNNVHFPVAGIFFNFKNQFYRNWTGSDHNFTRYVLSYNQFFDLSGNEKHILAVRANINIADGDVPFEGQSVVGGDDIRGYSQGKYRANQTYSAQAEYRWNFYKRFGMVGFFGLATAVDKFSDAFHTPLLPGIGVGLRFRMIRSEKINIGFDGAIGKNDYSLTFRIGEAFSR